MRRRSPPPTRSRVGPGDPMHIVRHESQLGQAGGVVLGVVAVGIAGGEIALVPPPHPDPAPVDGAARGGGGDGAPYVRAHGTTREGELGLGLDRQRVDDRGDEPGGGRRGEPTACPGGSGGGRGRSSGGLLRRCSVLASGYFAEPTHGHHATMGESGSSSGNTTDSACATSPPDRRSTMISEAPASPPRRISASIWASPRSVPSTMATMRLGCWYVARVATVSAWSACAASTRTTSVRTRDNAIAPAASWHPRGDGPAVLGRRSDHGILQTRPSRASISWALLAPTRPGRGSARTARPPRAGGTAAGRRAGHRGSAARRPPGWTR
jgi:hypothetical protein